MLLRPIEEYDTWVLACISCWGADVDPKRLSFNNSEEFLAELALRHVSVEQFVEMRILAKNAVDWLSEVDTRAMDGFPDTVRRVCMTAHDIWDGIEQAHEKELISAEDASEHKEFLICYQGGARVASDNSDGEESAIDTNKSWWKFW
jgi:hypothetical protein